MNIHRLSDEGLRICLLSFAIFLSVIMMDESRQSVERFHFSNPVLKELRFFNQYGAKDSIRQVPEINWKAH